MAALGVPEERYALKEAISRFVHLARWRQDEGGPNAGTVEIEFFEEFEPVVNCAKLDPGEPLVNNGASGCNGRLLE